MEKNILLGSNVVSSNTLTIGTRQNSTLKISSGSSFDTIFKGMLGTQRDAQPMNESAAKELPLVNRSTESKKLKKADPVESHPMRKTEKPALRERSVKADGPAEKMAKDDQAPVQQAASPSETQSVQPAEVKEPLAAKDIQEDKDPIVSEALETVKKAMKEVEQLVELLQKAFGTDHTANEVKPDQVGTSVAQLLQGLQKQLQELASQVKGTGEQGPQALLTKVDPQLLAKQINTLENALKAVLEPLQKLMAPTGDKVDLKAFSEKLTEVLKKLQNESEKLNAPGRGEATTTASSTSTTKTDPLATIVKEVMTPVKGDEKGHLSSDVKGQNTGTPGETKSTAMKHFLGQEPPTKDQKFSVAAGSAYQEHTPIRFENSLISFSKQVMPNQENRIEMIRNIMDQVVSGVKSQLKQSGEATAMTMKLSPQHLGNVEVKLELVKGTVLAEFKVENQMVKGALEANLADLKSALSDKGYNVENLNIYVDKDGRQNGRQEHQQREQNPKQQEEQPEENFKETIESIRM